RQKLLLSVVNDPAPERPRVRHDDGDLHLAQYRLEAVRCPRVTERPTGTVTFVFTDVEGSTELLRRLGANAYAALIAEHARLVDGAVAEVDGVVVDTQGDAFFAAFPSATGRVQAAARLQRELAETELRVRIGIHTGQPTLTSNGYVGLDVPRAARICAAGHGGQVL